MYMKIITLVNDHLFQFFTPVQHIFVILLGIVNVQQAQGTVFFTGT